MLRNRWMYLGTMLLVATALVWLGVELTRSVDWLLPYTAGAGVALLLIGSVVEHRASRRKKMLAP